MTRKPVTVGAQHEYMAWRLSADQILRIVRSKKVPSAVFQGGVR